MQHSPLELLPACFKKIRLLLAQVSLLTAHMQRKRQFAVWHKKHEGPCTSADLAVNEILRQKLGKTLPKSGWLSEENADDKTRLTAPYIWIVDPIDGTRDFIQGTTEFSISLALVEQNIPILGAVAIPAEKKIIIGCPSIGIEFWQYDLQDENILNEHDFKDQDGFESNIWPKIHWEQHSINVSPPKKISQATLLVSRTEFNKNKLGAIQKEFHCVSTSSIARKLALVAIGDGDLVLSVLPKYEWDIAGGTGLMLCHKNYTVIDLKNFAPHHFNSPETRSYGLVAGPIHLVKELCSYWKKEGLQVFTSYH